MGVDAILIASISGVKLLSRHYGAGLANTEATLLLERSIAKLASFTTGSTTKKVTKRCMRVGNHSVVFQASGELVVFLVGSDQDGDEIILAEALDVVLKLLEEHLEKTPFTTAQFLNPDCLGKMSVSIDELVCEGEIENLDVDSILKLSKMKSL